MKLRRGMRGSLSGTLATMGPAVPYAITAKFAYPERVAIALVGDGAMQMNVIDAVTDPNVPPIPPHMEWSEAKSLMKAVLSGDPDTKSHAETGPPRQTPRGPPHRD